MSITRRAILRRSAALAVSIAAPAGAWRAALAAGAARAPGTLPDPRRPAGTADAAMPFDHVVVVMMENHSFDNILGALSRFGQPSADGLTFNHSGTALNSNPGPHGPVRSFAFPTTAQGTKVSQTWNATHRQIDSGKMDGFVASVGAAQPMGYWTQTVLPFAYSLARTFTVANRWFGSAPCQTFPNRRFLMAGTAFGDVADKVPTLRDRPKNGTIFDLLHAHGLSWRNYFVDVPQTAILPDVIRRYPTHLSSFKRFLADCRTGSLPAVSFVDPEFGVLSEIGSALGRLPGIVGSLVAPTKTRGGDEEPPQDLSSGERWAHTAIEAVIHSPAWPRTLLIYTYDEHGGYYDHVPPPPAIPPDAIPPSLAPSDAPGGYDIYGPRVPAIVVSPYSRPNGTSNVICDHTSILATIEAKWNLPALTYRDANAATVADFLAPGPPALLEPPSITPPLASG